MMLALGLEPRDFDGWPRPIPAVRRTWANAGGAKVGCARKVDGDDRGASQNSIGRSGCDPCAVSAVCCRGGDLLKSLGLQ